MPSGDAFGSGSLMQTWATYLHCSSSHEAEEIRADLQVLDRAAQAVTDRYRHSSLLPDSVKPLVAVPLVRLAVDPRTLVQACAVHGGDVAHDAGQPDTALELLLMASLDARPAAAKPQIRHTAAPAPLME